MAKKKTKTEETNIDKIHKRGHKRIDTVYRAVQKDKDDRTEPYVEPLKNHLKDEAQ